MNGRKIRSSIIALIAAAALTPLAMALGAQNTGTQQSPHAQQSHVQRKARTYFGTIVKVRKGKYALMINPKSHRGYYLDDKKDASKYIQKKVLIKGKLNRQTGMLHVLSIRPAAH